MAIIKPKNMPPFWVLSIFGPSYDGYKYSGRLFRLFQEIGFKWHAVLEAHDLILEQEKVIRKLHKKSAPKARSYKPEVRQMAYLGFFLDAVYALTEKCSRVTKIIHDGTIKDGFNRQRNQFLEKPQINPSLSRLMKKLEWYDLFREIRVQHSHYGTAILAFGYDKDPKDGYSQLIVEVEGGREKKVLTKPRYNFDLRETKKIIKGVDKLIQDWSLVLLKKLDKNTTISGKPNVKGEITLKKFLEGR